MATLLARATDLHKSYHDGSRELEILRGVSMSARAGESISIMGTSGSGKSTLLHLLGALDTPTSGKVEIDGQDTLSLSAEKLARLRRRKAGFVFQFHHLMREFTAAENVAMPLLADGKPARVARERAADLLERVGLADRATHRPPQLSGGEQQRVAIARALANSPAMILADEPTGNLDEATAEKVADLLFSLASEANGADASAGDAAGRALILVTHDPRIAARATRRFTLTGGRLEARS
jgi:lipoprotein-releasing system ATP-binding protein